MGIFDNPEFLDLCSCLTSDAISDREVRSTFEMVEFLLESREKYGYSNRDIVSCLCFFKGSLLATLENRGK